MVCRNCGSQEIFRLLSSPERMYRLGGSFHVEKCSTCGLGWSSPNIRAKQYPMYYPAKQYYSYVAMNNAGFFGKLRSYLVLGVKDRTFTFRMISKLLKVPAIPNSDKPGKFLDIGCGGGATMELMKQLGWSVYGLDIDRDAIKLAKSHKLNNAKFGSYTALTQFRDNFFDVIRIYEVIEHLNDPWRCIKLAHKKLKPGGSLLIGTSNIESLVSSCFGSYWYNLDLPRHTFQFNPSVLKEIIKNSNFRIRKIYFCSGGGLLGSIQYIIEDLINSKIDLINRPILLIFFYPFEWLIDRLGKGDIFVIEANKE